jgi:hypothetical protein
MASAMLELAILERTRGDLEVAEQRMRESLAMRQRLFPDGHTDVVDSMISLAILHLVRGQEAEAEHSFREAVELCRRLYAPEHPSRLYATALLAEGLSDLAWKRRTDAVQRPEAIAKAEEAVKLLRESLLHDSALDALHRQRLGNRLALGRVLIAAVAVDPNGALEDRRARLAEAAAALEGVLAATEAAEEGRRDIHAGERQRATGLLARLHGLWNEIEPSTEQAALATEWSAKARAATGK